MSAIDDKTTREVILSRSLEMINEKGMVDFRIDTLAHSLGLSPGNITYHFSRKDDISVALWERYLEDYGRVSRELTTLLDIKQVYLINRANIYLNYKYRGVVISRSADLGAMQRDIQAGRESEEKHLQISKKVMALLIANGYIDPQAQEHIIEVSHTYHYILMRWCLNFAYEAYRPEEVESKLDYLALLSMHARYPIFSQKARDEFRQVMEVVMSGNLTP